MLRLSFLIAILASSIGIFSGPTVHADEPARAFLEALRENGYYDVAIEYLADLEKSDLINDEFRSTLPFEKADVLIASTKNLRDFTQIETRLDEAQRLLTEYASRNKSVEVSARTYRYQGNLLFQRSNIYLKQAESDRATENEKTELRKKSRGMLQNSLTSYEKAKDSLKRLLDPNSPDAIKLDADPRFAAASKRKKKELQASFTQVRLRVPMVTEQLADTYPAGNPKAKKLLTDAAAAYKDVYEKYRRYPAGLSACIFSARCQQKLGKPKPALELLSDIFELSNHSSLKPLKLQAYVLASDCWSEMKPYPHAQVVKLLEPAVKVLNRIEVRNADWLRVQLELGKARHANAVAIKAKGGQGANAAAGEMDRAAARVIRNVARVPSPHRDAARALLSEWNVSMKSVVDPEAKPPATFSEARQKAKDIISEIELAAGEAQTLRQKMKKEKDPAKKNDLTAQVEEADGGVREQAAGALEMLDLALTYTDEETIRADINNVRYLQSYCYFASRQYYESALIGEFLLLKYPTVPGTQQAMALMLQSYSLMVDEANDQDKEFEKRRLIQACETVLERWPGSKEAGSAASTMTRLALNEKNFKQAEKYLLQIPESVSYKNALGVRVGQRMWLDVKPKIGVEEPGTYKEQLDNAKKYMIDGVKNASVDTLDYETALGALMLVDAYVITGEVDKAVKQLESATVAPLDLVKQKHPAITKTPLAGVYARATYRSAVKTYLTAMKAGNDKQKWINKANGVLARMRQDMEASNDPKDRARITIIYRQIAKELKQDFDALKSRDEKKKFAAALEKFLGSIVSDSKDPKTTLWAGSTLRSVGDSLVSSGLTAEAKPLYSLAINAFNSAEKTGFAGDEQEADMVLQLKRQRALSERGAQNYEKAVDQLSEILKVKTSAIDIQIDACETLQQWGKTSKLAKAYIEATKGARSVKDPKTNRNKKLIMGWENIAKATRKNEKFRDTYYRALYGVAECRMEFGILQNNKGAIQAGGKEISRERERDPTFSGKPEWKKKFAELEARINAAKGG